MRPLAQTWCPECDTVGFRPGEWDDSHAICMKCSRKIYRTPAGETEKSE